MKKIFIKISASLLAGAMLLSAFPAHAVSDEYKISDYNAFADIEVTEKEVNELYLDSYRPFYKDIDLRKSYNGFMVSIDFGEDYTACGISFADCVIYLDDSQEVIDEKKQKREAKLLELRDKLGFEYACENSNVLPQSEAVRFKTYNCVVFEETEIADIKKINSTYEFYLLPFPTFVGDTLNFDVEKWQYRFAECFIAAEKSISQYFPNKAEEGRAYSDDSGTSVHLTVPEAIGGTRTFGDLNSDGVVDIKDLPALCKIVASQTDAVNYQVIDGDVFRDYVIDIKDLVKLLKYVAQFDGIVLGDAN